MRNRKSVVGRAVQSINLLTALRRCKGYALALAVILFFSVRPACAAQLVLNSSGGTATLGSAFILTNANVASPAGTLSINCPVTSVGGTYPVVYACSGGSFTFHSTNGQTSVTGTFTTAQLDEYSYGGGRGNPIHHRYQFLGNFTGLQTVNGVSAAIHGETNAAVGPLTYQLGSATAGAGATGVNSTYAPLFLTDYSYSQLVRSDDMFGTNKVVLGSTGTGTKQFYGPHGVALDASGRIYVVDTFNCRIVRVDDITGKNWTTLGGTCGAGAKQFSTGAADIALGTSGRIYVADPGNSRIVRSDDMSGTNWTTFGTTGSGPNQFIGPQGVAIDAKGKIYIADAGNRRIVRIDDMTGTNWTTLTQSPIINGYIYSFAAPAHVALDTIGRIVVGDSNNVIRVNNMTGAGWTTLGVGTSVAGVNVASDGTTYVAGGNSSGGSGVVMFDDITTGAGFLGTNLVGNPGGIHPVPVPKPVPAVTVVPATLAFGSENIGTTSAPQDITLTNFGGALLDIASVLASKDFIYSDTCPAALPGGSNCTIAVSYKPTVPGARTGTLTITDNAFTGTQSVALSGTGTAPVAGIAPTSVTFQSQLVHTTSGRQFVVLSNTGTGALSFSGTGISTSGDFAQTNNCGTAVLPATSCQITVTFTPTATGSRTGKINVTDNAGTQTVSLSGTGASAAPTVTASPESLVFPTELVHGKSAAQSIMLTNGGTKAVSVTSVTISGDFAKSGSCPSSLGPGSNCTLNITFAPTAAGTRTGALTYTLSTGVITVALTGTGTATANGWLTFSPASVNFNNSYVVGDNPDQIVTVTNTNGVTIGIAGIRLAGSSMFTQTTTCGTTLGAYASCTIDVTFTPTAVGTFSGTLTVTESAGTAHAIPLSGTAYTNGG